MNRFEGKVAFISGGARGQGRSHAVRLASEGADIVTFDICAQVDSVLYPMSTSEDLAETERLVKSAGGRIIAREADVRDRSAVAKVFSEGIAEFGHVDIVIANAGIMPLDSPQAFYDAVDVMLTGVWHTVEAAVPHLIERGKGGTIVITSSTAGLKALTPTRDHAMPGGLGYHAAKHGVIGLMRCYAQSLAEHRIRCVTVNPTGVNTPMVVNSVFEELVAQHPEIVGSYTNPMGVELIEPSDVSDAIAFLCSDEAKWITGISVPVDAGICNK
jgi:SDR family mycofactocin-dependent oxidoreductase